MLNSLFDYRSSTRINQKIMHTKTNIALFCLLISFAVWAQPERLKDDKHEQIFNAYLQKNNGQRSLDSQIIQTALFFLETPYVASSLEGNENEQLVINLQELDCTTFVENCLALSRTVLSSAPDFMAFKNELQTIRYRDGIIDGYSSRLHYTSDWITNNQEKNIIEDKTEAIGGIILPLQMNFMSTHSESYQYLSKHPEEIEKIQQIENAINQRTYYYVPKEKIKDCEQGIQSGDLVCFVTSAKGMDVSHVGIAYWNNGVCTFIHASSKDKKVVIDPTSIADYSKSVSSNKGIMILRAKTLHSDLP